MCPGHRSFQLGGSYVTVRMCPGHCSAGGGGGGGGAVTVRMCPGHHSFQLLGGSYCKNVSWSSLISAGGQVH